MTSPKQAAYAEADRQLAEGSNWGSRKKGDGMVSVDGWLDLDAILEAYEKAKVKT
jgi:hypothetical protein